MDDNVAIQVMKVFKKFNVRRESCFSLYRNSSNEIFLVKTGNDLGGSSTPLAF